MSRLRRLLAAPAVRFVIALAFMIAPWPGLGSLFVSCVGATVTAIADLVFSSSNVTLTVRSPLPEEHQSDWRGVIDVKQDSPDGPVKHAGAMDLRRSGYLQLAAFIALAAAWTPKGRRRALTGACVVAGVVSTVVAIPVVDFLAQVGAVHLGAVSATLVSLARRTLVGAPGMAYAVPGIAWLALTRGSAPGVTGTTGAARTFARSAGHR